MQWRTASALRPVDQIGCCTAFALSLPSSLMVPQLSVEILELIIDHTAAYVHSEWYNFLYLDEEDSTIALRACALTCSALRPRAHHHLYSSARITKDKHAGDLLDVVNRRQTLAGCVQTLEIMPEPGVPKDYRQYSAAFTLPIFVSTKLL
jgi:hypothetical protein